MRVHSLVEDSLGIVGFELGQLTRLLRIIDIGIDREIDECDSGDTDERMEIAYVSRYEKYTGIVMAFMIYERFLMDVVNHADREIYGRFTEKERKIQRWEDYVRELETHLGLNDYRLKAGRILLRLKVASRLKPPEAARLQSRLKACPAR